jgi:dTDP-4-dehydrorhamnose 3,5-epimerase
MEFTPTPIAGLFEVATTIRHDDRGSFSRVVCLDALERVRPGLRFIQANHSVTRARGTVRGLHWQCAPAEEVKLVRCLRGAVLDVVLDVRPSSPTFGCWHAVRLDDRDGLALLIPEGCAHGFQTLVDDVHLLYQHTAPHAPACERGVRHDDPALAIPWPLPVTSLSARDRTLPSLAEAFAPDSP